MDLAIVNSTIPNALTHGWVVGNDIISVNVSGNRPDGSTYPGANWVFIGLPASNSGFGNHLATLYVDGAASQTAHIQTFFHGLANNYPNAIDFYNVEGFWKPNWYHYYDLLYQPVTASPGNYRPGGVTDTISGTDFAGNRNNTVYIGDNTYGYPEARVFGLNCSQSPFLQFLGRLNLHGIHSFVAVCAHEQGHATAWITPGMEDANSDPYSQASLDGDLLVDTWEDNHHMNRHSSYTATGAYGATNPDGTLPGGDVPDNETIADIPALGELLAHRDLWLQDWDDQGCRKGATGWREANAATGQPDNFYWVFTPDPNHLPTGQGIPIPGSGNYQVRTLQDLQNLYPGTIIPTSWSDIQGTCTP